MNEVNYEKLKQIISDFSKSLPDDITVEQLEEYVSYHAMLKKNPTKTQILPKLYSYQFGDDLKAKLNSIIDAEASIADVVAIAETEVDDEIASVDETTTISETSNVAETTIIDEDVIIEETAVIEEAPIIEKEITTREKKKKSGTGKKIILALLALIVVCGAGFAIGNFTYPFKVKEDTATTYVLAGEEAKATFTVSSKAKDDKEFKVAFANYSIKPTIIKGNGEEEVTFNFGKVEEDTSITGKYGFMNMKKLNVDVVVVDKADLKIQSSDVKIFEGKNDLTSKKYVEPNKEVTFNVVARNSSGKNFERDYDLLINGKSVAKQKAIWDSGPTANMTFKHTFTKQGYYTIQIGDTKIAFICSTKDKAPANGTLLKSTSGGSGVLEIKNNYSYDVIVTLAKKGSKNADARLYIQSKKSATVYGIKDGTYVLYVKGGSGYSNMAKDILETKTSYKSTTDMKFKTTGSSYTIWTITLNIVGGNMGSDPVDDGNIPR